MLRSAAASLLLCLPATLPAADWVSISRYSGMHLELDTASLAAEGDGVLAWDRMSYSADRRGAESGDVAFRSARTLVRYDCARRTVVPVLRSFSQEDGTEILNQNVEGAELPQAVVPDTPRERMLKIVCKGRSAKPEAVARAGAGAFLPKPAAAPGAPKPASTVAKPAPKAAKAAPVPSKDNSAVADAAGGKAPAESAQPAAAKPAAAPPALAKAPGDKTPPAPAPQAAAKPAEEKGKAAAGKDAKPDPHAKLDARAAEAPTGHGPKDAKPGDATAEKPAPPAAAKVHWTYSGQAGAQHWHKLSREFAPCAEGKRQSPIDIKEGVRVQLDALKFEYRPSTLSVVNNGHTIQVPYEPGSFVTIGDKAYELVQFHFHRPAEERVNGRVFDMVAHLVHKSKDGQLAVVAVLLMIGDEHPFIRTLWNHLPLDVGLQEKTSSVQIDATQLLPKIRGYYTYMGSLTTPPCTEGVRWVVMRTPVQVSRAQVTTFGRVYEMNARPLQASNGRLIKEVL